MGWGKCSENWRGVHLPQSAQDITSNFPLVPVLGKVHGKAAEFATWCGHYQYLQGMSQDTLKKMDCKKQSPRGCIVIRKQLFQDEVFCDM